MDHTEKICPRLLTMSFVVITLVYIGLLFGSFPSVCRLDLASKTQQATRVATLVPRGRWGLASHTA